MPKPSRSITDRNKVAVVGVSSPHKSKESTTPSTPVKASSSRASVLLGSTDQNCLRKEFRLRNFGLGYDDPFLFIVSQWPSFVRGYLLWRLFWFLWYETWVCISGQQTAKAVHNYQEGFKWFLDISNLTLMLTAITCMIDMCMVNYYTIVKKVVDVPRQRGLSSAEAQGSEEIIFLARFTVEEGIKYPVRRNFVALWLLYNITYSLNVLVSTHYWIHSNGNLKTLSSVRHMVDIGFVVLNLSLTATPIRLLHFIYPMIFLSLYLTFSIVYFELGYTGLNGQHYLHQFANWRQPTRKDAVSLLIMFAFVLTTHSLIFLIYKFRVFLHSKLVKDLVIFQDQAALRVSFRPEKFHTRRISSPEGKVESDEKNEADEKDEKDEESNLVTK